jgi:hypothetical protein
MIVLKRKQKEQIEVSKFYEKITKATCFSCEWLDGKIYRDSTK